MSLGALHPGVQVEPNAAVRPSDRFEVLHQRVSDARRPALRFRHEVVYIELHALEGVLVHPVDRDADHGPVDHRHGHPAPAREHAPHLPRVVLGELRAQLAVDALGLPKELRLDHEAGGVGHVDDGDAHAAAYPAGGRDPRGARDAAQPPGRAEAARYGCSCAALARELTAEGVLALWTGLDAARIFPDVERAEAAVLRSIHTEGQRLPEPARPPHPATVDDALPGTRLQTWLAQWSRAIQPRQLVLFLDEADGLRPEPLLSVLAQLRGGYPSRVDGQFPSSIGLVGLRDLRDYVVAAKGGGAPGPTSPFNIQVESFTLADFTRDEMAALYAQHTADTGQPFAPEAADRAAWWSRGQPYLVNALAARCVDVTVTDQHEPVRAHHIDEAAEHLIRARVTHLDNLAERLREPRVARVLQAVLLGEGAETVDRRQDDFRYVLDLGLLTDTPSGLAPANPMYGEVLTRELTVNVQAAVALPTRRWRRDDGSLDVPEVLAAWRAWWRQNADVLDLAWAEGYPEAVPHLVLLASWSTPGSGTSSR